LLILFFACGSQAEAQEEPQAISQPDFTVAEALARAGLTFFPEERDWDQSTFSSDLLTTEPISYEDINDEFTNIDDLRWLIDAIDDSQCVLVGETHYYRYIENLKNRILFALNTEDYYPLAVFECQYSSTPYINYYLDIEGRPRQKFKPLIESCKVILQYNISAVLPLDNDVPDSYDKYLSDKELNHNEAHQGSRTKTAV